MSASRMLAPDALGLTVTDYLESGGATFVIAAKRFSFQRQSIRSIYLESARYELARGSCPRDCRSASGL